MNIKDRLYRFFSIRLVQHLSFWTVFVLLELGRFVDMEPSRVPNEIIFGSFQLLSIVIFVYFNLRFLIPKYWNKGNYLKYILLIVISEIVMISFLSITFYLFPEVHFKKMAYEHPERLILFSFFKLNIFTLSTTLFHFVKEWIALKDENLKFTAKAQEQLEAELNLLKEQVNPHFLFNTLNNIYSMSLYDSVKTPEMILKLSQLISYMLYECKDEKVKLEKEVQFINNYIELESLRVEDTADINLNISGEDQNYKLPPLLFIPLIENTFKHGIHSESGKSEINIDLHFYSDKIELKIVNPIDPDQPKNEKPGGLGIQNVKKRLNLLYPKNHSFIITENETQYQTLVCITLNKEYEH
ncbi:sensor histidine kinase [Marinifilum flexuosum]|uniref:sensor histidine kinase n=1 Tax=Marinifilum flexuosum TaxID=1117708 RepID=UPI00248F7319|nr:histidine kinase [Marinifilum flexuosum]